MSSKLLVRLRKSAFHSQSGLCYYCGYPMWERDGDSYSQFHKLSLSQAKLFKCTAEHLLARQDGGIDHSQNIVAACQWCNQKRHNRKLAPSPVEYRKMVKKRLSTGRWFCKSIAAHFWKCSNLSSRMKNRRAYFHWEISPYYYDAPEEIRTSVVHTKAVEIQKEWIDRSGRNEDGPEVGGLWQIIWFHLLPVSAFLNMELRFPTQKSRSRERAWCKKKCKADPNSFVHCNH